MTAPSPTAHGGDRIAVKPDGSIVLSSRWDKGWVPRREEDLVHARFPGTCIQWGDEHFEVVRADAMGSGVRYLLAPWNEANAIRTLEHYDAESERVRAERRAAEETRKRGRTLSIPLALVLGDLPAAMQDEMESEYGITASRLTLVSIIPLFMWGVFSMLSAIAVAAGAPPLIPKAVVAPGLYFFLESLVRFSFTMSTGRPMGSFPVVFVAETIRQVSGRGRKAPPKLAPLPIDPSIAERDAYRLREPYLAFLSPDEQLDFASRYGFNPILWGKRTAWVILVFSLLGIVTGIRNGGMSGWISALVAGYFAVEQIARLRRLARDLPAGSILGVVVGPMAKRLRA